MLTSLRVTAVLSGVDTPEVKLRADDLPLARLRPAEHGRLVVTSGAVHPAVTAVPEHHSQRCVGVGLLSPGGDTILLLFVPALALVLARLTVPTPGLYQHLQDIFHLLPGATGSLAGPALVVARVGLYHGGNNQGGAPLPSDLLEPSGVRGREVRSSYEV